MLENNFNKSPDTLDDGATSVQVGGIEEVTISKKIKFDKIILYLCSPTNFCEDGLKFIIFKNPN